MDYDITWKNPTEAQLAALKIGCRIMHEPMPEGKYVHLGAILDSQAKVFAVETDHDYGLSAYDYAEILLTAESSLWYTQAKQWAKGEAPDKTNTIIFEVAGKAMIDIVEWGYQNGQWWDLNAIFPTWSQRLYECVHLLEAIRLASYYNSRMVYTMSAVWTVLPRILFPGLRTKPVYESLGSPDGLREAIIIVRSYFDPEFRNGVVAKVHESYKPTKCIHPQCENLVAPANIAPREGHYKNYRGTGACRRGHNSYLCTKCKAPHSFVSKIGKAHYPEFYGRDFDSPAKLEEVSAQFVT